MKRSEQWETRFKGEAREPKRGRQRVGWEAARGRLGLAERLDRWAWGGRGRLVVGNQEL